MSVFRTKNIDKIVADASLAESDSHSLGLKRVLTAKDLTFFGIAAVIGAGSFSSLGGAVFNGGPGVVILFVMCGIACGFTAYCYCIIYCAFTKILWPTWFYTNIRYGVIEIDIN